MSAACRPLILAAGFMADQQCVQPACATQHLPCTQCPLAIALSAGWLFGTLSCGNRFTLAPVHSCTSPCLPSLPGKHLTRVAHAVAQHAPSEACMHMLHHWEAGFAQPPNTCPAVCASCRNRLWSRVVAGAPRENEPFDKEVLASFTAKTAV